MYGQKFFDEGDFLVRLGTHDINNTTVEALVEKIHLKGYNDNNCQNDIAILELKEKVANTDNLSSLFIIFVFVI